MKAKSIKTPAAPSPSVPSVVVTLETVKVEFMASITGHCSAKDKLTGSFNAAKGLIPDAKLLRKTLVEWSVAAGVLEKTAKNIVSGLFLKANISLRKRGSKPVVVPVEYMEAAQECLEHLNETCENNAEIIAVLTEALKLAKAAKTTAVPAAAPAVKAA